MNSSLSTFRLLSLVTVLVALAAFGTAAARAEGAQVRTADLGGLEARSAALLLSGQEGGELETSFLVRTVPSPTQGSSYLVVADLVGASLLEAPGAAQMILEVYAYALDAAGQPRASLTRAFRLDPEASRALLETGGVKFLGRLDLPAGMAADSLRLLVLHRASGRFSLATLDLSPAALATDGAPSTPLLALERAEPWLVARSADDALPEPVAGRTLPVTRLVASAGGSLSLGLTGRGSEGFAARLLDADGQPLGDLPQRPAQTTTGEVSLDLADRAPGSYLLELADTSGPGPPLRLPLVLVPEQLAEGTVWFRPPAEAEQEPATELARPPSAPRSALAQMALAAYQRAFEAWAASGLEGATAELRRFEAGATPRANSTALSIQEGQVRAASELVAEDDEALVALMCLHERLYRFYRIDGSDRLARHSQHLASEFARLYAERGGREARQLAALVPVSLAGMRQEMGTRLDAQATFERALELDPNQSAALLGLAALHESLSHYETTVELLRRLQRTGAMSPEARLRLAVNLGRVGSRRQALDLLTELTDAKAEWISRLAYQERARLLAGSQRAEEALEVLVEARRRYPHDQALTIQEAALLDELGKPLAGQRVLAAIADLTADRGDSPRLRYSALPSRNIEAARARLQRAAQERLAGLLDKARRIQAGAAP